MTPIQEEGILSTLHRMTGTIRMPSDLGGRCTAEGNPCRDMPSDGTTCSEREQQNADRTGIHSEVVDVHPNPQIKTNRYSGSIRV